MTYTFPGVWPFIERIAHATGRDLHQLGRAGNLWHVSQVQNSLGQIPGRPPDTQAALLAHARTVRESLALSLEGVDAAIAEVVEKCGLEPDPDPKSPIENPKSKVRR